MSQKNLSEYILVSLMNRTYQRERESESKKLKKLLHCFQMLYKEHNISLYRKEDADKAVSF